MNEILLISLVILALLPLPYDFYGLYRSNFKSVGLSLMKEASNTLSGTLKTNQWSFDQRYTVEGVWNGYPIKITLGTKNLSIELHTYELPKQNLILLKYPKFRNEIFQIGKTLNKLVPSSEIWNQSYSTPELEADLENIIAVLNEIKSGKSA